MTPSRCTRGWRVRRLPGQRRASRVADCPTVACAGRGLRVPAIVGAEGPATAEGASPPERTPVPEVPTAGPGTRIASLAAAAERSSVEDAAPPPNPAEAETVPRVKTGMSGTPVARPRGGDRSRGGNGALLDEQPLTERGETIAHGIHGSLPRRTRLRGGGRNPRALRPCIHGGRSPRQGRLSRTTQTVGPADHRRGSINRTRAGRRGASIVISAGPASARGKVAVTSGGGEAARRHPTGRIVGRSIPWGARDAQFVRDDTAQGSTLRGSASRPTWTCRPPWPGRGRRRSPDR